MLKVLSKVLAVPVMARLVVVAKVKSELPKSVVEPKRFESVELRTPLIVVEPVTASEVEVAAWSEVPPSTVSEPLALSAPPTLSMEVRVVEPVTAKVPVEVAPVVVRPPLKVLRALQVLAVVVPKAKVKVRSAVKSPPPWRGYVVLMRREFGAGVKPKSEVEAKA